jgi:hypothetical protein
MRLSRLSGSCAGPLTNAVVAEAAPRCPHATRLPSDAPCMATHTLARFPFLAIAALAMSTAFAT